jgi:hypothetical protein
MKHKVGAIKANNGIAGRKRRKNCAKDAEKKNASSVVFFALFA